MHIVCMLSWHLQGYHSVVFLRGGVTSPRKNTTEGLKLLRFATCQLILYVVRMHVVWPIPLGNSITRYRSAPSSEIGDFMETEDTSERDASEEQSGLGREEKQSVQGYIAIKGTRNGLLLTLEPETPFSELLKALSDRLAEAPGFFRGAYLAVDTSRRLLRGSERTQLENHLANYQMSVTSLEQIIAARKDDESQAPPPAVLDTPASGVGEMTEV